MAQTLQTIIQNSAKYCRDSEIRQKIELFLQALRLNSVRAACAQFKKAPRYYYYWYNRYRDAGFDIAALHKKSCAPKRTRRIPESVAKKILSYSQKKGLNAEQIQTQLHTEHQIRISRATIYRHLKSRSLAARRGKKKIAFQQDSSDLSERIVQHRYRLQRKLGEGGGGTVYLAQDLRRRHPIALKLLETEQRLTPALVDALKTEFFALSSLQHPHLAKVYDLGISNDEVFFSSEYIRGEDILQVASHSNLNTVFEMILQMLRALDYLHGRGVLHLDLKPQNILVEARGEPTVKLIDFGGAQWRKHGEVFTLGFLGTPPYTPPEVYLERPLSPASDIYSLGILLYQIFAGRVPFSNSDPVAMMKEQVYGEAFTSLTLHPALPPSFGAVLAQMIQRDPAARFQSAREVLQACNQSLGENFSLRGRQAPRRMLEESDFVFRQHLYTELLSRLGSSQPQTIVVSGLAGSGKTRLCHRLKNALQLNGKIIEAPQSLEELEHVLKSRAAKNLDALLIDGVALDAPDAAIWLSRLENLRLPVLMMTQLPRCVTLNPALWIDLNPLEATELREFFASEILECPASPLAQSLAPVAANDLRKLETSLQSMREENWLQWSEQGWRWTGEASFPPSELESRQQARWAQRLRQILEWLEVSPSGMSATTLAGILGVELEALQKQLDDWTRTGQLRRKLVKKILHYFSKAPLTKTPRQGSSLDWDQAQEMLERLYERGDFSAGVEATEAIFSDRRAAHVSEGVALACARHLVAAGQGQAGLRALPAALPQDPARRGLYHELHARVRLDEGEFEAAKQDLAKAELDYREAADHLGLSRTHNVRASLFKRLGNFPEAEAAYLEAIAQAEGAPYPQGMARMNLAILYYEQGRFSLAQENFQKTFVLEKVAQQPLLSTKLRDNWVNLLFFTGRSAEAESCCYELLKISLHHRYRQQEAAAYSYLALLSAQKGDNNSRLRHLDHALALLDPEKNPLSYFQALIDRGYAQLELHRFTASQIDAEGAFMLAKRRKDTTSQAVAHLLLGKIFRDRPNPDLEQASFQFNLAHQWIQKNQIAQLLWEVEFERGRLEKKQGQPDRAKNYFRSAQSFLLDFLQGMPPDFKNNFLRDRQLERITAELQTLETP